MAFEISENMSKQGALSAWGDKVIYNMELSQEEKEFFWSALMLGRESLAVLDMMLIMSCLL